MDFNYIDKNGKTVKYTLNVGDKWSSLKNQGDGLKSIFSMIDDGDDIVEASELNIFYNNIVLPADNSGIEMSDNLLKAIANDDVFKEGLAPYKIAQNLFNDIREKNLGIIPTTGENFEQHIRQIYSGNIKDVLLGYFELAETENVIIMDDIMCERGIDIKDRISYVKHIFNSLVIYAQRQGADVDDLKADFEKEARIQEYTLFPASGKVMDRLVEKVIARIYAVDNETTQANGKLDGGFSQGDFGDCWLIATINSLANNETTRKLVEDQIKVQPNGDVIINLKHVGKTYRITKRELEQKTEYVSGDLDVRALEMAIDRYLTDECSVLFNHNDLDAGGYTKRAAQILLGTDFNRVSEWIGIDDCVEFNFDKMLDALKNKSAIVNVGGIYGVENGSEYTTECGDTILICDNHAYSVVDAGDEYIYLANPHDTSKIVKFTHEEFLKIFVHVKMISLDEIKQKHYEMLKKQYNFSKDTLINDDGRVLIYNKNGSGKYLRQNVGENRAINVNTPFTKQDLAKIKSSAEKKYGNDYTVQVNTNGDILLTPKV